jgi:RNA polymerase sigma-70 factor (ECF subfamily)
MMCIRENERVQSDSELVVLARKGDKDAFGRLVNRHYQSCVNFARLILRDMSAAQDEVQTACWKAFEHLQQYNGAAEFSTWLLRIVKNQCLMQMRVRKRTQFSYLDGERLLGGRPIELPDVSPNPEQQVIHGNMQHILRHEIRRIPTLLRNVILLRDVEELSMEDIAQRLRITIPTAKSRLRRARIELRNRVVRHYTGGSFRGMCHSASS